MTTSAEEGVCGLADKSQAQQLAFYEAQEIVKVPDTGVQTSDSSSFLGRGKRSRKPSSHNDFDSHNGDESEGEDDEISAGEDDADEETTSRSASKKTKGERTLNDRIEITIYPMSVNSTTRNLHKKKNNKVKNFKGISHDDFE